METLIYEKLGKKIVKCSICRHFCVIREGERGICGVRENKGGRLLSLVYPKLIAASVDPIEKKPLFHLKPGSFSYSIATVGCNFKCSFCQNSNIAQMPQNYNSMIPGENLSPESIVKQAIIKDCKSISYTYTEPTVFFELALKTAKLAKKQGLFNVFVTNGYMSQKALEMVAPYLDAVNVDLKAFNERFYKTYCKAKLEPVKENIKIMKDMGILVEITTLLIPGLNDDKNEICAMADYIANDLGKQTPWHISRFHPSYLMNDRPATPVSSLEKAYAAGKAAGLSYVYIGNVPGQSSENTYCSSCNELLVRRYAFQVETYYNENGKCPKCSTIAYGIY
ncbi:MAG: AmmeMemoRadiSam system radical SAM enzyme [Desulfobacula sp.]|jgi:pyruvate formate lyase activating enzyme|uniref:AmmeMemoRadiSam system radical SAM enzyme n=1 Tax=Desulfobacula sp. TaxID=2593537 RepID=UPI001DADBF85|nr:AmmeMemoRadiSam system radical SAM enzyme [Desulfobacula sp.]MBT3485848.1 AmmeMemoRadiSam system radical SAM enzyme [Desulfobacula sp.]MBT3804018.1 AmmeMemoRadiSam system radical SAM enzyme [Desulfobacula sp.]MBT4023633.1 AmmeMemoRadiSam system radical SAM enzyme [Desulfobacula sp.]MBT4197699.1 AmmeMemoRadiSam system radical SAM enzyme [Desulfobacula sp.]